MAKRLVLAVAISSALLAPIAKAAPYFGELYHGDKKVVGFIYEYEGKNYIPIPVYESLGMAGQAPRTTIPQCGECVALEDFAEVQRSGIRVQLYPFANFQQQDNQLSFFTPFNQVTSLSEQTWAYWVNYRGEVGSNESLLLDNNLSTPWGTLNARTSSNQEDSFDVDSIQFIHENIADEYEIVLGDINTSRLAWGGNYALSGVGYFNTDPRFTDRFGLAREIAIDIENYTELEIIANGRSIYKGFQGAGQFLLDNVFTDGLVDIEIRKDNETAEYYQFYFDRNGLPEGETNVNFAVGQFNRGPFRYDMGIASHVEYGITNNTWVNSSLLATQNDYIAGLSTGVSGTLGSVQVGYSQSNDGDQVELGYEYFKDSLQFNLTHIEDNGLDNFADRSITTARVSYNFSRATLIGNYTLRDNQELFGLSLFTRWKDFTISSNVQHANSETSFNVFFNYRLGRNHFVDYSISDNDARGSVRGNYNGDNYNVIYSASQSREQGELVQLGFDNQYVRVNSRFDGRRNTHRTTFDGSLAFDGSSLTASARRVQSIGIVTAKGGDISVQSSGTRESIEDGESIAVGLRPYAVTEVQTTPTEVTMSVDNKFVAFSSGRIGAYKADVNFISPGVNLTHDEGQRGDTLLVEGKTFKFFPKVGYFVKDLITGDFDAAIVRDGKTLCEVSFTVTTTYSKQPLQCEATLNLTEEM